MAKGSIAKESVAEKILNTFNGAFQYDKEIRIPMMENGEELQIKVALTCAKTNVEPNGDVAIPGATSSEINFGSAVTAEPKKVEVTQEEKDNVSRLAEMLGL